MNAKIIVSTLTTASKIAPTVIAAVTVGNVDRSIDDFVRKIWMMFAPPAGTMFLNPTAAT